LSKSEASSNSANLGRNSGNNKFGFSSAKGDLIGDSGNSMVSDCDISCAAAGDSSDIFGSAGRLRLSGKLLEFIFIRLLECSNDCGNGDDRRRDGSALLTHLTDGELNTSGGPDRRNGDRKELLVKDCDSPTLFSDTDGTSGLLHVAAGTHGLPVDMRLSLCKFSFTILLQTANLDQELAN